MQAPIIITAIIIIANIYGALTLYLALFISPRLVIIHSIFT